MADAVSPRHAVDLAACHGLLLQLGTGPVVRGDYLLVHEVKAP